MQRVFRFPNLQHWYTQCNLPAAKEQCSLPSPCTEPAAQQSATVPAALGTISGITDGALWPGHSHGEMLHPGSCTITFWWLRLHCAIRKFRQLRALTKLLLLSAICTVVFAHWLYCQMSPLVLCANKKIHPAVVQACWRSLAESVFPISIAQSNALIPRLRQESHCSLSRSSTPACRGDSAGLLASTQLTVHPLRVRLFPSRNALSAHFSHVFQASVILTQQRVPKPAGGVLKWGAIHSVSTLWCLKHAPFSFLRSCISHSQEDRRSWQRCDLITSRGSELLRLARACCCLLLCFGWLQNWVEADQAKYIMIHWFSH